MKKGNINVSVENIFPLIKKFLYSDHEIFLRELISNATDATIKLKHIANIGKEKIEVGDPKIEVKIDKKGKKLHIIDQGIGMTSDEIEKYINEVAFSGAEEFLEKYKDSAKDSGIIGHFGLGFYSAFMVSKKVEIISKSYKNEPAAHWTCDGSPNYTLKEHNKKDRGTEIILHIDKDSKDFLEDNKISELLVKYNKFMPVPIKFGTKEETIEQEKDSKKDEKPKTKTVDNIINNPNPAWTKQPKELKDDDYKSFYRELYPMQFEEPLFNIHLNVDYPFNLTGILYFPKLNNDINIQKDKIQLYQNQVFVTDLQADGAVKKISAYITRKVADKLSSLFKSDRKEFEKKWNDIKIVIEYGMLSEEKFFEKSDKFALYPSVDDKFYTYEELYNKIKAKQTDKDEKLVILYASDKQTQHSYIQSAKQKGYEVLLLDSPIVGHLLQKLEGSKEKIQFARVDSDHIDNLIKKDTSQISKLNDDEKKKLEDLVKETIEDEKFIIKLEPMDSGENPFIITNPEFMRRMKEMQQSGGGGMFGSGNMPEMYNLVVNTNSDLINQIVNTKTKKKQQKLINQSIDLAKLSHGLLTGEALTEFIKRSYEIIK